MSQSHPVDSAVEQATPASAAVPVRTAKEKRTALISSFLGTAVEFYDFLLYATASALVFPELFFDNVSAGTGVVLSYLTLAVGYVARPVGAVIFGHFGDRLGRKQMLVVTMLIMGVTSVGIGLMPTTATVGAAAPVLLVTLRLLQGIAVGGEWAGATLMALEYSGEKRRGLGASISMIGAPTGVVAASLVFSAFATLPEDAFMSWGWRIPFLLSAVLVVLALVMRMTVRESPEFEAAQRQAGHQAVTPLATVAVEHWRRVALTILVAIPPLFMQALTSTYYVTSAVEAGHSRSFALFMVTVGSVLQILFVPVFAALSDRVGRTLLMTVGFGIGGVGVWGAIAMIHSASQTLFVIGFVLGMTMTILLYAPLGAYLAEQFDTRIRYTGVSLTYQLTTLATGFAPVIAIQLTSLAGEGNWWPLALLYLVLCGLALYALGRNQRLSAAGQH